MDITNRSLPGTLSTAVVNSTSTTIEAIAAVEGQKILVWGLFLVCPTASMTIKSGSTALTGPLGLITGTPINMPVMPAGQYGSYPYFETAVGEALNLAMSPGVQVSGLIYYSTE